MTRNEKLRLSADAEYGHCFKQGLFVRLYEQSLYWFHTYTKPLRPMWEKVKDGDSLLYGGLPISSFDRLCAEGELNVTLTPYGYTWNFAQQRNGHSEDFSSFPAWREATRLANRNTAGQTEKTILHELRQFNVAASTPMQAMQIMADWQSALRKQEGAE